MQYLLEMSAGLIGLVMLGLVAVALFVAAYMGLRLAIPAYRTDRHRLEEAGKIKAAMQAAELEQQRLRLKALQAANDNPEKIEREAQAQREKAEADNMREQHWAAFAERRHP